jgi:hypothetical protein
MDTFIKNKNIQNKLNNNNIYKELLAKQRKNIDTKFKFSPADLKRVAKYLNNSIFNNECNIWLGYITNNNNDTKGTYINFYFKKRKIALHRLLYINFVDKLSSYEYIKYTCKNKGRCCCINHIKRIKYKNKILKKIKEADIKKIEKNIKKKYENILINKKNIKINF